MTVSERMAAALLDLASRTNGRRRPKAFYLGPDDWTDFMATNPPTIATTFNLAPCEEPSFDGVPVRASKNVPPRQSRLYDHTGTGRPIPSDPSDVAPAKASKGPSDIPARDVFAALDRISRDRALTERESIALEEAMKGRVVLSVRHAARLGIKRTR